MVQEVPRRGVSGPTLIRLLARLTDADVSESRQPLSDRLSLWLGWTDAIALSTVLEGGPLAVTASPKSLDSAEMREYERMRAALTYAIADEKAYAADVFVPTQRGAKAPTPTSPLETAADYKMYRQRYQTIQQAMETSIAKLRGSLRATLATQTPERARLAVVDAILERSLSIQERQLLSVIPGMLEKHFKRLRQAAEKAEKEAEARLTKVATEPLAASQSATVDSDAPRPQHHTQAETLPTDVPPTDVCAQQAPATPAHNPVISQPAATAAEAAAAAAGDAAVVQKTKRAVPLVNTRFNANRASKPAAPVIPLWLSTFRKDMRSVLLAELDIRLQPIEGLLAALRAN